MRGTVGDQRDAGETPPLPGRGGGAAAAELFGSWGAGLWELTGWSGSTVGKQRRKHREPTHCALAR